LDRFVKIFYVRVGRFADMDKSAAVGRQFNKHSKWHHANDNTDHLVAWFQLLLRRHGRHHCRRFTSFIAIAKWIA
jgi:hypothetical protein